MGVGTLRRWHVKEQADVAEVKQAVLTDEEAAKARLLALEAWAKQYLAKVKSKL